MHVTKLVAALILAFSCGALVSYLYYKRANAELISTSASSEVAIKNSLIKLLEEQKYERLHDFLTSMLCAEAKAMKSIDEVNYRNVANLKYVKACEVASESK